MNNDNSPGTGRARLPGFAQAATSEGPMPPTDSGETLSAQWAVPNRAEGIRRVRRMSNWTAAALIVGTGAATVALAHNAIPASVPLASSSSSTTGVGSAAVSGTGSGPQVSHSVATTSASGVTTTTTTRVVNGKTVVSHVKSLAPGATFHD